MALVNQAKREINAKIVFFGPGQSGKSTNLKHIHGKLKQEVRGAMKAMSVQDARMFFFDFTPPGDGNVQGYRVRFHVYTVSGELVDPAAWKMVLKGVDGVIFVADAAPERAAANRDSLAALTAFLKGYGQTLSSIPVVLQYNKADLPGALPVQELDRELNPAGLPSFKASSESGEGVLPTLLSLVKSVVAELRRKGVDAVASAEGLHGLVEAPPAPAAASAEAAAPSAEAAAPSAEPVVPSAEPARAPVPHPEAAPAAAPPASAPVEEPLSLELAGAPQHLGSGMFRLPLTVRSGERTKSVYLNVALTVDEE